MKIRLLWLLLMVLIVLPSRAQDTDPSDYRLRVPSAEEYLRAVPGIINTGNAEFDATGRYGPVYNFPLFEVILDEIYFRYPDLYLVEPSILHNIYDVLVQTSASWAERDIWNQAIILSWLNHSDVDLSETKNLTFLDYQITITARDFNGDDVDEWVLDAVQDDNRYRQMLVVTRDDSGYHYIPTPLPWFASGFYYVSVQSGTMEELAFDDFTGDGLPEWVYGIGNTGGGHATHGSLHILQWQDGQLVDITPDYENFADWDREMHYSAYSGDRESVFPNGVTVNFANDDDDAAIEITIHQEFFDNWECVLFETRIFDWTESIGLYQLIDQQWEYSESGNCELRLGQEAMWDYDYESAIPHFERSLALFDEQGTDDYAAERTYTAIRLALAYSLTNRTEDAAVIIESLEPVELYPISDLVTEVQRVIATTGSTSDLCLAMYDVFSEYSHSAAIINRSWSATYNIIVPNVGQLDANRAGCDIERHIFQPIAAQTYTTGESPVESFTRLNITTADTFHADLNMDGIDDWLVWLEAEYTRPILFLSADDTYNITRPYLPQPDHYTELAVFPLPENAGVGLMYLYGTDEYVLRDGEGGPFPTCVMADGSEIVDPSLVAYLSIYRVDDDALVRFQSVSLCQVSTFDDIFPNSTSELHGWQSIEVFDEEIYFDLTYLYPAIYNWDAEQGNYVISPETEVTPPPDPLDNDVPRLQVSGMLQSGEYEQILAATDEQFALREDDDFHYIQQARYYRALALGALGRTGEALAEYVAIYEAAPDSAWGMLAGLHIERVE